MSLSTLSLSRIKLGTFNISQLLGGIGNVLWLKADALAYSDNGVTLAVNNDPVQRWDDSGIYGCNATQATLSKRPIYLTNQLNSLPILQFTKESFQMLTVNNQANFNILNPTIFLVGKWYSGADGAFLGKGDSAVSGNGHRKMQVLGNTTAIKLRRGTDALGSASASATPTNWNVYAIQARQNNLTSFNINGVETLSTHVGNNNIFNTVALTIGSGFSSGAEYATVDIAEIIIFNRLTSDEQTRLIINYLSTKYNISVTNSVPADITVREKLAVGRELVS